MKASFDHVNKASYGSSRSCGSNQRLHTGHTRYLIPNTTVQLAPTGLGGPATPLLVKERHAATLASVADVTNPCRTDRARVRAGLSAGNDPSNAVQVEAGQRAQQRFARQKPYGRRYPTEFVNASQL